MALIPFIIGAAILLYYYLVQRRYEFSGLTMRCLREWTRPRTFAGPPAPRATPLHSVALRALNAYRKKSEEKSTTLLTTLIGAAAHG